MDIIERLPSFSDAELKTLLANASRLETAGTPKQQTAAQELLPLIHAEVAGRKAAKPAKAKAVRAKAKAAAAGDPDAVKAPKRAPRKAKVKAEPEAEEETLQEL